MSALHLLSNPEANDTCLAAAAETDAVLLVGDGVFAQRIAEGTGIRFGALGEDLASRGLEPLPGIEVLTYREFVDWVVAYSNTVTWR